MGYVQERTSEFNERVCRERRGRLEMKEKAVPVWPIYILQELDLANCHWAELCGEQPRVAGYKRAVQ